MYTISTRYHFDSAHFLKGYKGKCANMHGHRWEVEAKIVGEDLDKIGMLVDFGVVKQVLKFHCDRMDHKVLNKIVKFNPTAENLSKYFYQVLKANLRQLGFKHLILRKVRVYESPDSFCEYGEGALG